MASIIPSLASSSSSIFTLNTMTKFHHRKSLFARKNPYKLTFKVISSGQISKGTSSNQEPAFFSLLKLIPNWLDEVTEQGTKKKRNLYNHDDWVKHRSSLRHVRHFLSSFTSRVILSLVPPVFVFTSVATVITGYNTAVSMHWFPEFLPVLSASSLPYQLTAPALALLLVFRTEASYSRFEEGQRAWTKLISGATDFASMVMAFVQSPKDSHLKKAILQYIIAFPVALKCHIVYDSDIASSLQNLLEDNDLAVVVNSKHPPNCILGFISKALQFLDMEDSKRHQLVSKLYCFQEGIGVCEQLVGSPIPLLYTRLTSRFLVLWHFTLPIILWDDCHWIVIPATFISAASLFCIEEVGVLIEEPFSMLALDELCNMLHQNITEAMKNDEAIHSQIMAKINVHDPNGRVTLEHSKTG